MKKENFGFIFMLIIMFANYASAKWEKANPIYISCIENFARIDSHIIALGSSGMHFSCDYGNTWDPDTSQNVNNDRKRRGGILAVNNFFFQFTRSIGQYIFDHIYVSSDYGKTWHNSYDYVNFDWDPKSQIPPETKMAVKDTVVFAAVEGYLLKSYDFGKNWDKIKDSPYTLSITAVHDGIYVFNHNDVLFSSDEGLSWTKNTFLTYQGIQKIYEYDNHQYALDNNDIIFISSDSGKNWNKITDKFYLKGVESFQKLNDFIILTTKSGKGVYKSSDDGITWTQTKLLEDKTIIPSKDDIFLNYCGAIYCSSDKGETWEPIFKGYSKANNIKVNSTGKNVYGLTKSGVYWSPDFGTKWYLRNDSLEYYYATSSITKGNNIYLGMGWGGGVFLSDNNGNSWELLTDAPSHVNALFVNDSFIYAGLWRYCMIISSDNGVTWQSKNCPINSSNIYSIMVRNGRIIIGSAGDECGIFSSDDDGKNWQKTLPLNKDDVIHNIISIGDRLFAGSNKSGIYSSSDNGSTWESKNSGMTDSTVNCIISKDSTLFTASNSGVYYSNNYGLSWIKMNHGLGSYPKSLTVAGKYLFASADTTNGESSWSDIYRSYLSDFGLSEISEQIGQNSSLDISPNPATDHIEISVPAAHTLKGVVESVRIYNIFGELVLNNSQLSILHSQLDSTPSLLRNATPQEGNLRIDVSSMPVGVYFVRVGEKVGKFLKL